MGMVDYEFIELGSALERCIGTEKVPYTICTSMANDGRLLLVEATSLITRLFNFLLLTLTL